MDVDELDAWLGDVDDREEEGLPLWGDASAEADARERGRWQRIAAIGGALIVVALVGLALASARTPAEVDPMGLPAAVPEGDVPESGSAPSPPSDMSPDRGGEVDGPADEMAAEADAATDPGAQPEATGPVTWPGDDRQRRMVEVAGALAVREHLVTDPDQTGAFVERLGTVDLQPLAEGIGIVTVDAVWLTQDDGAIETASRAQFAVPITIDGRIAAAPWLVGVPPAMQPTPVAPPLDLQRGGEAQQALQIAGWTQVAVHACEPHPDVPGVWHALIDGVDPAGRTISGQLVWLEDVDGFRVAGVAR